MKKVLRRIDNSSLNKYKYNFYNTNESEVSQSNTETNPDKMKDLSID